MVLAAAIVEEAFFRRMIMDGVISMGGGGWLLQIFASAVIFGVAHGVWRIVTGRIFVGSRPEPTARPSPWCTCWGTGGLAPPIVSHFLITAIQPGITVAAFSGQMRW